jgi:hypothetical protein
MTEELLFLTEIVSYKCEIRHISCYVLSSFSAHILDVEERRLDARWKGSNRNLVMLNLK